MRRIIAALSITALFACSDSPGSGGGQHNDTAQNSGAQSAGAQAQDTATLSTAHTAQPAHPLSVVFIGTSLTAGYGVGPDVAYPNVIQQRITEEKLPFTVTNAGISGETSAGGLRRIDWVLQNPVDVLVLELGANDGLRGLDTDSMKRNLDTILQKTRAKYPTAAIVIAGMEAPPNLGVPYTTRFHNVFTSLATKYNATLVPFLLQGVAGKPRLNQEDGIHPNPEGHRVVADNVWSVLKPVLINKAKTDG